MLLAPDDLLPPGPERWTRATVSEAWQHERRALRAALLDPANRQFVCLVGVPGSGKSTWARDHEQPGLVIFDACWTDPGKRRGLATQIRAAGKIPIAVWLRTPLAVCRERNAARPPERRVPDVALLRAAIALRDQPPTVAEGWVQVLEVDGEAERIHDAAVPPERQLERATRLPANVAWKLLRANVLPELRRQQPGEGVPKSVERALATMERQLKRGVDDRAAEAVSRIGQRIEKRERQTWNAQVSRELGQRWAAPEPPELVSDWAERQHERIREIRERVVPGIRASIEEARRKGWSTAQLEAHWKAEGLPLEGYGTAEGRGQALATEAAGGLRQEATRAAQEAAGAEWYTWGPTSSANPDPEHAANRGKRFRWSDPPPTGHPGERHGCGCTAVPVLVPEDVERLKAEQGPRPEPMAAPAGPGRSTKQTPAPEPTGAEASVFGNGTSKRAWRDVTYIDPAAKKSKEEVASVGRWMATHDPKLLAVAQRRGASLGVYARITDDDDWSHLKGVRPRGWPEGSTWDDLRGGCGGTKATVAVRGTQGGGLQHGDDVYGSVAVHEFGHAIDKTRKGGSFSHHEDFKALYEKAAKVDGKTYDSAIRTWSPLGYEYFEQEPPAGAEELWAEVWSELHSPTKATRDHVRAALPEIVATMERLVREDYGL